MIAKNKKKEHYTAKIHNNLPGKQVSKLWILSLVRKWIFSLRISVVNMKKFTRVSKYRAQQIDIGCRILSYLYDAKIFTGLHIKRLTSLMWLVQPKMDGSFLIYHWVWLV